MSGMTPKDLAAEMNINPKSLRRFIRAHFADHAGSGNRYNLEAEAVAYIRANYGKVAIRKVVTLSAPMTVVDSDD